MIMRCTNTSIPGVGSIKEIHPIVIKYVFAKVCKNTFSFHQLVNVGNTANIPCITTSSFVAGYLPFRLYKESKLLYDGFYNFKFIYGVNIFLILVSNALLVKHPYDKMTFVIIIWIVCIFPYIAVAKIPPIRTKCQTIHFAVITIIT